jgi:hypothetical protein
MQVVTSKFEWKSGCAWQDGRKIITTYEGFCNYVKKVGGDREHLPGFDRSFIVADFDVTDDFAIIDMWFSEDV